MDRENMGERKRWIDRRMERCIERTGDCRQMVRQRREVERWIESRGERRREKKIQKGRDRRKKDE